MKHSNQEALPNGSYTNCMDCGKAVIKKASGGAKRCRTCRDKFWGMHPESSPRFKSGKIKTVQGYITVAARWHPNSAKSNGRICEHRLVMEKKLGRYLKPNEVVHHLNGIRDDNRPSNLVVCQSTKEHFSHHARPPCMICGSVHRGRGFCYTHYKQWYHAGSQSRGLNIDGKWFKPLYQISDRYLKMR